MKYQTTIKALVQKNKKEKSWVVMGVYKTAWLQDAAELTQLLILLSERNGSYRPVNYFTLSKKFRPDRRFIDLAPSQVNEVIDREF